MDEPFGRLRNIEIILWIVASIIAFALFLLVVPALLSAPSGARTPAAWAVASRDGSPASTYATAVPLLIPRGKTPVAMATPVAGAQVFDFAADVLKSGWMATGETDPHWGDRNLHAGFYKGQIFQSLIYFDLASLAPGSRILYAEIDLTGLSRTNLGGSGTWGLKLLPADLTEGWQAQKAVDFRVAAAAESIGDPLGPLDLLEGQVNQFAFSPKQLELLSRAVDTTGHMAFRLDGPGDTTPSLFTWDGGTRNSTLGTRPFLRVVALPGEWVFITNTPVPQNVMTAAALLARATQVALRDGTPTLLPRQFATAPAQVAVTPRPTPANEQTVTALSDYATAVAFTTGTFTPTPLFFVTASPTPTNTPTPPYVALSQFTPIAVTPTPREISILEYPATPIPSEAGLIGKIAFITDREGMPQQYYVVDSNGTAQGKFTGRDYYTVAAVHDLFSPDYKYHLDFRKDARDKWEIVLFDVGKGEFSPLIQEERAMTGQGVYHPAWSPDGTKIAFVSNASVNSDIWVYDIKSQSRKRITWTLPDELTKEWADCKHPSWSPDGKEIVFSSNRNAVGHWQLWIMDAEGNNLRPLSPSTYNDYDPVWIKR